MSAVRQTRSLARKGLKVQRRVVLAQTLFWPAVVGAVLTIGAVTVAVRRATKRDEPRTALADGDPAGLVS